VERERGEGERGVRKKERGKEREGEKKREDQVR
jgi:hypothetical protein